MDEKTEITKNLAQFIGTEQWYRYNALFRNVLLTDGALYVAESAGVYWLMDAISSYLPGLLKRGHDRHFWKLTVNVNRSCKLTCTDGNDRLLVRQRIGYTDFPLDEIEIRSAWENGNFVIFLPTEY